MEYKPKSRRADDSLLRVNRKGLSVQRSVGPDLSFRPAPLLPNPHVTPRQLRLQRSEKQLTDFTVSPMTAQRQALAPMLEGLQLQRDFLSLEGPVSQRQSLQRQIEDHQSSLGVGQLKAGQYEAAVQRQADLRTPVAPLTQRPSTPAQWSQGGQWEVQRVAHPSKPGQTISLREQEQSQHLGMLRTVGTQLGQSFRSDTGPAVQRYAEYGAALAPFQRLGTGTGRAVVTTALMQVPASQRVALQRAIDETIQRQQAQETQDRAIIGLHSLQRQLEHLNGQPEQPVMEQIQARRGAGNPIPDSLRKALELELNHDLGAVRVHDDAEADMLAKKVNAVAFTTGQDIFFRAGTFNPNTQTGVELIAHEVTHTKQQAQGRARPGIDADAGLESEAREMGRAFSRTPGRSTPGRGLRPVAAQTARVSGSLQRLQAAQEPALLQTLTAGQAPASPFGFVWQTADGGVNIRDTPMGKVLGKVPNTTRLQLLRYDPKQKAYAVRSPAGVQGWVAESHLKIPPPQMAQDANLRFYAPKKGEGVFAVVAREYGATEFSEDARYFTNVLRAVNRPDAFRVTDPKYKGFLEAGYERAVTAMTQGRDANGVQLKEATPFWLPSPAAAKKVKAPSGSFSKQVLDTTRATFGEAGEAALYGGLFLSGLQVGLLRSLWDAIVGLVELVKLPITVLRSIYNVIQTTLQGQLLNKVQEIYAFLAGGGLQQIASMLVGEFKAGWNNKNPLRAWEFRGEVIGYVATEIITTFIPIAGIVLKAAKAGKVMAFLSSKFKWISAAGRKAVQMLDKVIIRWPPPGMSPQMAMAGGMAMSAPQQEVSLGQVLRMARSRAGAAGTAALSKAEQLAEKAANWPLVKKLIGKDPPAKAPDGYFYRVQNGKKQMVRVEAEESKFAALTIDEKGKVRVADPSVSDRISNPTAMNKSFKLAMGRKPLEGYQLHHLIPDNKVRSHPLMQWAQGKGLYNLDHAENLVEMPGTVAARTNAVRKGLDSGAEAIGHFGSHGKYDEIVDRLLNDLNTELRREFGRDLSKPGAKEAFEQGVKQIEQDLKKLIKDGKVPTRIDPETGFRVIAQNGPAAGSGEGSQA